MRRRWLSLLVGLLVLCPALVGATAAEERGVQSAKFALELDGVFAGWLYEVEGGHAVADVVTERLGADWLSKKHIGNVKYEEITLVVGANMSKAFYDWIAESVSGQNNRKNGAVVAADFNYRETSRLTFTDAFVTELAMPALDAASKDAAKLTVKVRPAMTRRVATAEGAKLPPPEGKGHKQWLPANFRLRIGGLEETAMRVNKIEALVIKQKVVEHAVGEFRDYDPEPGGVEVPNLVITLPESHGQPLYDWHESFVIQGNAGEEQEKGGSLEYLAPDLKTVLFRVDFQHLGIFKLAPDKSEAGAEGVRRLKAEMYCEDIRFSAVQ